MKLASLKFTEREKTIMKDMVNGIPAKQTMAQLGIAESTVMSYRGSVYRKLKPYGVTHRPQLVSLVLEHGIITT